MTNTLRIAAASIAVLLLTSSANAALVCGWTQMRYFGIHDRAFALARHWLVFPRTVAHPGAVVVSSRGSNGRSGHVARIVAVHGQCSATVTDEKGTYVRDICRRQLGIVDPNGNGVMANASYSAKTHSRHKGQRYAPAPIFVAQDRLTIQ